MPAEKNRLNLLPYPKSLIVNRGKFALSPQMFILLEPHPATRDVFAAERFEIEAEPLTGVQLSIAVTTESVHRAREIRARFDPEIAHEQGYRLTISPQGIDIFARSAAGTFYAFQTLMQIVREAAWGGGGRGAKKRVVELLCVEISDWPDLPRRGVYHDCSRGKVPKVETLLQMIDDLGHLKINEFQLYVENVFEFRKHPAMYDDTTPLTAEEILLLDTACRARHIDFVPSLTSLGHFEKILSRPAFRHLAEAEPADLKKAGINTWSDQPWTLCVTDPGAKQLLQDMYNEFVPNFTSPQFNICCDESWDLGKGRSKFLADKIGQGQLYVDWVNYCNGLAKGLGKRIQMWGDIILNHPELIPQLPADCTLLEWGYESHHKFDEHCRIFAERIRRGEGASQAFYVAPGTTSWLSLAARTRNALGNIHNAVTAGLKYGAAGVLTTDWGDNGHQQLFAVSMLPFAYGAAAGWNLESIANPAIKDPPNWDTGIVPAGSKESDRAIAPFLTAASLHLFNDPAGEFAALAYDLGLTYERFSWQRFNGSLEWFLFREKWDFANYVNRAAPADFHKVIAACEKLKKPIARAELHHPDAEIIKDELLLTIDTIIHTCNRTALRQTWLAADPMKRNPEHEILRAKPPRPLPKTFKRDMRKLAMEVRPLARRYEKLWKARNKTSRLEDVLAEFKRLEREYKIFTK